MRVAIVFLGLVMGVAAGIPALHAESAQQTPAAKPGTPQPTKDEKGEHINIVNCEACVKASPSVMTRGRDIARYLEERQALPPELQRILTQDIEALLRGKSWTSAVLATSSNAKEYQRLLQFDADGRGRWLNFYGGRSGYSAQCHFETDENLLCLACGTARAECSALYRDKDNIVAYDPEQNKLEIFDWIMKARWDDNRFLIFR